MPFSLPPDTYKDKTVLAIGPDKEAVSLIKQAAAFCSVIDYSPKAIEVFNHLETLCPLEVLNLDIREPLPLITRRYDVIISQLIPAEAAEQNRFFGRLKPLLQDGGRLFITRHDFEKTLEKSELPDILNDNGFILTTTLHPELPLKEARLIINNLSDPYPMNERFLAAIIASLAQKEELILNWDTVSAGDTITLTASGDYDITLTVDKRLMVFKASMIPAGGTVLNTLSDLALLTFCQDVKNHSISKKNGYLLAEVTAAS